MNHLYEFTARVAPGDSALSGVAGASLLGYAAAESAESALREGVLIMTDLGYQIEELGEEVRELPAELWAQYVAKVWPEQADELPNAEELVGVIERGEIFFGPLITYAS